MIVQRPTKEPWMTAWDELPDFTMEAVQELIAENSRYRSALQRIANPIMDLGLVDLRAREIAKEALKPT